MNNILYYNNNILFKQEKKNHWRNETNQFEFPIHLSLGAAHAASSIHQFQFQFIYIQVFL